MRKYLKIAFFVLLGLAGLTASGIYLLSGMANSVRLPEKLKKPPLAPPPVAARAQKPAWRIQKTEDLEKIKTYEDYLRWIQIRNPGMQSISLYLQLCQRFKDEKIWEKIAMLFFNRKEQRWSILDTITPEQAVWLVREADTLALLHRFSQAGPLPSPTFEERQSAIRKQNTDLSWQHVSFSFIGHAERMLAIQARWRYQQGDCVGATQSILDVLGLTECYMADRVSNGLIRLRGSSDPVSALGLEWLGDPAFPQAELNKLASAMEALERKYLTPEWAAGVFGEQYLIQREIFVAQMERPTWRSDIYGWFWKNEKTGQYYDLPYLKFRLGGVERKIPHYGIIAARSLVAINARLHSAEGLAEFDRQYLDAIARAKVPYAALREYFDRPSPGDFTSNAYPGKYFLLRQTNSPKQRLSFFLLPMVATQTQFHLFRLGARWRQDAQGTMAARKENLAADPFNPWRDPYTERPLQVDTTSSPTLLWSLGPDLKDQHGQIVCNPSIRKRATGDLIARIAH